MNTRRRKFFLGLGLTLGLLLAVVGGYYLLRYQLWAAYRNWSFARMNDMARDFLAADDPRSALLTVRKVLRKRPNDAEAWRLGAEAARRRGSAEAIHFQRNLCRVEETTDNYIELIRLAVEHRVYGSALEAIQAVAADARERPEYHRLAAEAYRGMHREISAKYHLISLLSLAPDDAEASLALAEIELESDPGRLPPDWPERVERLARAPATALPASLLRLRRAVALGATDEVAALVAPLQARSDLTLTQQLQLADALLLCDAPAAEQLLAAAQARAAATSAEAGEVMAWLARHGRPEAIVAWHLTLPEATREDEAVKLATARALDQLGDWPALERLLRGPAWEDDEALRMALLARAYRMMGRNTDFAESWKLALIATGRETRVAARLLQTVEPWHWPEERLDVLWQIFNLMPSARSVRDELVTHEYRNGNTVNLNKIYARVVDAAPDDDETRNNFAYTSLLLDSNLGRAQAIARDLHAKHPDNASYLTTYTLALHKQGRSDQALALVEGMGARRATASGMLHEAAYAAAVGRIGRAAELLPLLARAHMLPEERQMVAAARLAVAREEARAGRQLAAQDPGSSGGWLAGLADTARDAPEELRLADAFYREQKIPALLELLESGSWKEHDHLRHALRAYAQRSQVRAGEAEDAWRQALAAAGRDARRLRELETLAAQWDWTAERMEAVARRFERDAANPALLADLLDHYRRQKRTPELARVLWLHVNETKTTGLEAAWCVYYSLLCDMNLSPAQTLAPRMFAAAPQDPRHRVAYAFALGRQKRAAEAWECLQGLGRQEPGGMQRALVEAEVLLELGREEDARTALARFAAADALPEEIRWADTLARQSGLAGATTAFTLH